MEHKIKITKKTDQSIVDLAQALREVGLAEFANYYYKDDEYYCPFFVIEKPYAKEDEDDPDTDELFIDVTDEYTLHTRLGHEHYDDARLVAETAKELFDGTLIEFAFCRPTLTERFLVHTEGDSLKTLHKVGEYFDALVAAEARAKSLRPDMHKHEYYELAFPNYLQIIPEENYMYEDSKFYFKYVVFGECLEVLVGK